MRIYRAVKIKSEVMQLLTAAAIVAAVALLHASLSARTPIRVPYDLSAGINRRNVGRAFTQAHNPATDSVAPALELLNYPTLRHTRMTAYQNNMVPGSQPPAALF